MSVFHNRRYDPPHLALQHAMSSGQLGEIHSFDASWCRWRPKPPRRWRETLNSHEGGGVLLDLATHLIDTALQLAGPASVVWADIAARRSPADDDARVVLEHASGAISTLHASNTNPMTGRRLRAIGSEAAFEFASPNDDVSPNRPGEIFRGEERRMATLPSLGLARVSSPFTPFYVDVLQALSSDDPQAAMPVQPDDAVAVADIVDQARELSEQRRN